MKMVQLLKQIEYISERGVGACEAMGVARPDAACYSVEALVQVVKSVLCKLVRPRY